MAESKSASYDEVPYLNDPYPQSHPDRLAAIALLFGMRPAPIERCRVLELGCGGGGNLVPMAFHLPGSAFVGIDLSRRQIDTGQRIIQDLGLKNIALRQCDILEVDASFGQFDYIITHGVYSWIPQEVKEKLLAVCADHLAEQGVAYVSYNTYPGWHMHAMIRDMMCYHTAPFKQPAERIQQARALLNFLAESVPVENNPYGMLLKREVEFLSQSPDPYLFHEFLEEINDPVYFHQFVERAAAHKLQYIGEADIRALPLPTLTPRVDQVLRQVAPNWVHMQQYLDFLRNTQFRMSLLCHDRVTLNRVGNVEVLSAYRVAADARAVSSFPDILSGREEEFRNSQHESMTTPHPIVKAGLQYLGEVWPQAVAFEALEATASARSHPGQVVGPAQRAEERHLLASALMNCCLKTRLVELHVHAPLVVSTVTQRPTACPLVRYQAATGEPRLTKVTNRYHQMMQLQQVQRMVIPLLDGSRDRAALVDELYGLVQRGVLGMRVDPTVLQDASKVRAVLARNLDELLGHLVRSALLIG